MSLQTVKVRAIRFVDDAPEVCDVTVEDNHNLFVCHGISDAPILAHNCLEENRKWLTDIGLSAYSLETLEGMYGFRRPSNVMSKEDRGNMEAKPLKEIATYGQYDVLTPWLICHQQQDEARDRGDDYSGFMLAVTEQISDIILSFANMERWGLLVDKTHLLRMQSDQSEFVKRLRAVEEGFRSSEAAQEVNRRLCASKGIPLNSMYGGNVWNFRISNDVARQMLYFDVLGLEPVSSTKSGGSTDKHFQAAYKDVPEVALLGEYSKVKKLYTAFVQSLWRRLATDEDAKIDGCIRCTFNYLYVLTGRSSASEPNLQQIPSRDSLSKPIKRMFISAYGEILLKVDYAAHEVRGWGNISGDQEIAKTFRVALALRRAFRVAGNNSKAQLEEELKAKGDIHIINVKFFYNQDVDKKHHLRQAIKNVVFGVIYGKGARALAVDIKDTEEKAKALIKKLFERWSAGARWLKATQQQAARTFRAISPLGRVRHLWGYLHFDRGVHASMDRRGPNSIIQGNASDLGFMASACLRRLVWNMFQKRGEDLSLRQINSVHDSGTHACRLEELPIALYLIEHAMTTEVHRRCRDVFKHPLVVDLDIDVEIGGSEGSMDGWDLRYDAVLPFITRTMDWQTKELGYVYSPERRKQILEDATFNLNIVAEARRREVLQSIENPDAVSYTRLIHENNVSRWKWKLGKVTTNPALNKEPTP